MTKFLLIAAVTLAGMTAKAQLTPGTQALDFTFTDIEGAPHNLYEYLDQGKTVFIDVSTAWCSPCWLYHSSHQLREFYAAHGPSGSPGVLPTTTNDIVVLFVEAELTNTGAQLTGTSTGWEHDVHSMGDWTAGTPYPIIDLPADAYGQAFIDNFAIQHYPTILKICPNRAAMAVERWPIEVLYQSRLACTASEQPVDVVALDYLGTERDCSGYFVPKVRIQNNGSAPLTQATVTLTDGNTVLSTGTLNGTLQPYEFTDVDCSPINGFNGGMVAITATAASDANAGNGVLEQQLSRPAFVPVDITVHVRTDRSPEQTTWEIRNNAGEVIAGGGPYEAGADNFATKFHEIQLPAGTDCYSVHLFDWWGNGMVDGENPAGPCGLEIFAQGQSKIALTDPFYSELVGEAAFYTDATSAVSEANAAAFSVYPNPASGTLFVEVAAGPQYSVALTDLQGRVLVQLAHAGLSGEVVVTLPIADIAPGNYLVSVTTNGVSSVKTVVVE